jgi:hypothetical protein
MEKGAGMEPVCERLQTAERGCAAKAPCGACGIVMKEAYLRARFKMYPLPDDFVPEESVEGTVRRIREEYSNFKTLLEEVELLCIENVTYGGKCAFRQDLVLGTAWLKCASLGVLYYTLKELADAKAAEAFDRRFRGVRELSEHR